MNKLILLLLMFFLSNSHAAQCGSEQLVMIVALEGDLVSIEGECGRFPATLEEIRGDNEYARCARRHIALPPQDIWGNAYQYEYRKGMTVPLIKSIGADRKMGTDDDISNYLEDGRLRESYWVDCERNPMLIYIALGIFVSAPFVGYLLYRRFRKASLIRA